MDSIEVETRVNVTEEELEALRRFDEDVTVEELEAMTPEEMAELRDSMPDDLKSLLSKIARAVQIARDKAILEQMSRYMDEEAERLLRSAKGGAQ